MKSFGPATGGAPDVVIGSRSESGRQDEAQEGSSRGGAAPEEPKKLFKIGEVMRYSGLSRQTIHNYTSLGLITEAERTPAGHRLYDGLVFERLRRVQELKKTKTLLEVREFLDREERSA
jgi:hypothetical protein